MTGGQDGYGESARCFDDVFTFSEGSRRSSDAGTTRPLALPSLAESSGRLGASSSYVQAPAPTDALTVSELNFILKAIQSCVGEFPAIELGSPADRPEHLRRWRYAVRQSLESAGPQVMAWWTWCWEVSEAAHKVYMRAPVMSREGIRVPERAHPRWVQIETWIKPRLLACLPQQLKKQLTQRGVQGIRDEVQDILFLILKTCCPGVAD